MRGERLTKAVGQVDQVYRQVCSETVYAVNMVTALTDCGSC